MNSALFYDTFKTCIVSKISQIFLASVHYNSMHDIFCSVTSVLEIVIPCMWRKDHPECRQPTGLCIWHDPG